jgi:hypothetical protein
MTFPAKEIRRVPDHWKAFSSRRSLKNVSAPRYATDPINAMLNLLYRLVGSKPASPASPWASTLSSGSCTSTNETETPCRSI